MFEDYAFMDSPDGDLDDFGIFHLNVDDASALIAKILFLEGELEVNVPEYDEDYSLYSPKLEKRLSKQIKKHRGIAENPVPFHRFASVRRTCAILCECCAMDFRLSQSDSCVKSWILDNKKAVVYQRLICLIDGCGGQI